MAVKKAMTRIPPMSSKIASAVTKTIRARGTRPERSVRTPMQNAMSLAIGAQGERTFEDDAITLRIEVRQEGLKRAGDRTEQPDTRDPPGHRLTSGGGGPTTPVPARREPALADD